MPFFSIIIPVFNAEPWLEECLRSIIYQSFQDFEVCIVNDGSTDSSKRIIANYCEEYPNIHWSVIDQSNMGLGAARNRAANISKGKFLAFLDSDDYWSFNKLESIHKLLAKKQNIEWLYHSIFERNSNGELRKRRSRKVKGIEDFVINGNPITPSATIISRELFLKYKGFDEERDRVEDLGLWIRLLNDNHLPYCLKKSFTVYRVGSGLSSELEDHFVKVMRSMEIAVNLGMVEKEEYNSFKKRKNYEFARQLHKSRDFITSINYYKKSSLTTKTKLLKALAGLKISV